MPYLIRYAGDRTGRFRPITRRRIIIDLRMAMPAEEVDNAILRIDKGQKVRTRAATYYYTEEPLPTKEEVTERLRNALSKGKKLMGE